MTVIRPKLVRGDALMSAARRQVIPIPGYGQWRTEQIRRETKRKPKSQLGPWPDFGSPFYNSRNQRN